MNFEKVGCLFMYKTYYTQKINILIRLRGFINVSFLIPRDWEIF